MLQFCPLPTSGACLARRLRLYIQDAAKGAYREGSLGKIGGVDTYMAQNVPSHTTGADLGGTVNAAYTTATISYDVRS